MDRHHSFYLQFLFFDNQRDQAGMNVIAVNDIRVKRKDVFFHSLNNRFIEERPGIHMLDHIQIFFILQEKNRKVVKWMADFYNLNGFLLAVIFYAETARFFFFDIIKSEGLIERDDE